LQYLDLDYGLSYGSQVPGNEYNPIITFLHELMHGFGMFGFYPQAGFTRVGYDSTFDTFISTIGGVEFFTGAHAEAAYGGPVPLTTNSPNGENNYHFGNQQSDFYATPSTVQDPLTLDLMNGIVFFTGYTYAISNLDLGVLQDLGYTLRTKPVVTVQNVNATRGEFFPASSLFSVSTAANDGITAYQFWDSTPDSTSGYWTVNGAVQPAGQAINVAPGQLASTTFQTLSGSDRLWVRVSDGVLWSDWVSFNVNGPVDHTPVITAPNYGASHNQSIAASSLFSVSDQDNDTITAYQLWDSTSDPDSGYWVVGGVAQPAGQAINVAPSQLSSTMFQSASGADQLWVRANDGLLWGDWKSFTVNAPPEHPPTVTAPGYSAMHGENVAATSLFSATDAENDLITAYQVWDSTADASSGYWIVGGVPQLAGRAINITPSQLSSASFQSASGTDLLWVRATDGVLWSNWQSFNVSAPVDHAPVVVPVTATYAATHNQNIPVASLFTVSDADHDTITAYQFWDSIPANGHWVVGGLAQPAGQAIDVTPAQLASATYQSGSGSDHLWVRANDGTEWGAWQDFYVNAPINHPPMVSATNFTPTTDQVAAVSLFSVTDADNDAITAYQFWESQPGLGHWVVGGVAEPSGQAINVTPAQLAGATFQGASGGATDHLWVRANDGSVWSAWQDFYLTTPPDHAPVVTAADYSASHGQNIAATSLFSVSDTDNDPITAYQFEDLTADAGSGSWVVGGVTQSAGQPIDVTPAQLASASFQSGSGTDQLEVRASDGVLWSSWATFNVNAPVDHAPVVTGNDVALAFGANPLVSSLFGVTDADRDSIQTYELLQSGDSRLNEFLTTGPPASYGQAFFVDATSFQDTRFATLDTQKTSLISERAYDGMLWSDWHTITVTTT